MPKLAQEAHEAAMDSTVNSALQQAGVHASALEAVAVTVGPGLSLCLKVTSAVHNAVRLLEQAVACNTNQMLRQPNDCH